MKKFSDNCREWIFFLLFGLSLVTLGCINALLSTNYRIYGIAITVLILFAIKNKLKITDSFIYLIENRHYSPMVSLTPTPSQLIEMIKTKETDEDDENILELASTIQTRLFDENYCKTYGGVILLELLYVLETEDELMKLVFHDKNSMEWLFYALTVNEPVDSG